MNKNKKLARNIMICLLAGSSAFYGISMAYAATSVIANNALPSGGEVMAGQFQGTPDNWASGLEMNIHQNTVNGVIKWDSFDVGGSATVNFTGPQNFNSLNYVNGGNLSQIYGTINANGGNIFLINPAGVQIGNSAQINVGSLYVSNKKLDDAALKQIGSQSSTSNIINKLQDYKDFGNGELMSLGNINATNVTFEGDRIVIDTERLKNTDGRTKLTADKIIVKTNNTDNVVLGYDAYDAANNTYAGQNAAENIATVNGSSFTKKQGYMWVEDIEQLQAMNTNLSGNYALRNSIDATSTAEANAHFTSIGNGSDVFTGKLDGLGNNIFSLTVNNSTGDAGLFAATDGAVISNVNLIGGSITGTGNVGALIGSATNTTITNVTNTANVNGTNNSATGGIVGAAQATTTLDRVINTGTISGVNNVGGLVGTLTDSKIIGTSYNLGAVTGSGYNVGGLVGSAENATIGDGTNLVYNRLDVTGAYNVGGIVGSMNGSTVKNAENSGNVAATGFTTETYKFHTSDLTTDTKNSAKDGFGEAEVQIANAGGIAGSSSGSQIQDVQNSGDVTSFKKSGNDFYDAGNVGGVVGRAENTNISNAVNKENDIRGAHNVGGIAGYFGGSYGTNDTSYTIENSQNSGGDIMATGARYGNNWVTETVRKDGSGGSKEAFHVGNMGGIAGYVTGDNTYIQDSSNSGNVHSLDITTTTISDASKAANTGGIAGKLDRSDTEDLENIKNDSSKAAISGSYNTGTVRGFTGIGGVVGMMYNGEVAQSYNVGTVKTTRKTASNYEPANMGGIVGDATELTDASALIYDVYNTGQIGDETYTTYARHVGGIVGRFSGTLEKAYNTGNIYNNDTDNGGIIGYWYKGNIKDVFNTGNITINGQLTNRAETGGLVGGLYGSLYGPGGKQTFTLTNAYNLGSIRVMDKDDSSVAGIIGGASQNGTTMDLTIKNVYTTGDIYVGSGKAEAITTIATGSHITVNNAAYIEPSAGFSGLLTGNKLNNEHEAQSINSNADKDTWNSFWANFIAKSKENSLDADVWRIYGGTTPILNAFTPDAKDYVDKNIDVNDDIKVQYGTAYNPLLTIITGNGSTIDFDWSQAGITGMAGLVVNGSDLVINNMSSSGNTLYSGTIYTDRDLIINSNSDMALGSASKIYGSSVVINSKSNLTSYGTITATGAKNDTNGTVNIDVGSLDNYGVISTTASGEEVTVAGIGAQHNNVTYTEDEIQDAYVDLPTVGDQYAITTKSDADTTHTDITITGADDVNLHYGNAEKGYVHAAGDLSVTSTNGDLFSDSDLFVDGNLLLSAKGETLLSLTNIGQVQSKIFINDVADAIRGLKLTGSDDSAKIAEIKDVLDKAGIFSKYGIDSDSDKNAIGQYILQDINKNLVIPTDTLQDQSALRYLHQFLGGFTGADSKKISLNGSSAKLTINMWDASDNFDLDKYDIIENGQNKAGFIDALNGTNISVNGTEPTTKKDITYIEITDAEQLKNIQSYADDSSNSKNILSYNFALMNDVDASKVTDYKAIGGSGTAYTGTFDGRDYRIIGLNVENQNGSNANAGVFGVIGAEGTVENLRVYSSKITGTDTAGAIAGINNGTIQNVTTIGNDVTVQGSANSVIINNIHVGAAGGIAGINTGTVDDVETTGSVVAGNAADNSGALSTAGGIVGINQSDAKVNNSYSDSAVTASAGSTYGLGGVAGVNFGTLSQVDSLGVTRGLYIDKAGSYQAQSGQVGGIAGINTGIINSGYNESVVNGSYEVGGIAGINNGGTITNVVNAANITGDGKDAADGTYTGGLVGNNSGSITNGRNNGEIIGHEYVGGLVGSNAKDSTLTNLVNDSSASITGDSYVGGIAGSNAGTITADEDNNNLINRGSITGNQYVGGVAGLNTGTIKNTNNDVVLNAVGTDAKYFGGVVGWNDKDGTIENATNRADIYAEKASYVGGVAGKNDGKLQGFNGNYGNVTGKDHVGGVIGENTTNITDVNAENAGTVTATGGGAGGIFGVHTGDITDSTLKNTGKVIGTGDGGTGGIATTNSGNIINSTLTNEGEVINENGNYVGGIFGQKNGSDKKITSSIISNNGIVKGNNYVGGIFGTNESAIANSSMFNSVKGQVSGNSYVGGLVGSNSGTITGGRNNDNTMYEDKIYNNGVITAAGYNIGGLIGSNEANGSLTAGYNTGAINAGNSSNVGGIVGNNVGTVDQVFNTVFNSDGTNGTITGGTNVGGIIGSNSGTLTNAYNTTAVNGAADSTGSIVGNNSNSIKYVYGSSSLVGTGNGTLEYSYEINTDEKWNHAAKYEDVGFDFTNTWKIYEGYGHPLLKVFLTSANYDSTSDTSFVYNGKEQGLDISKVTAADNLAAYHKVNQLLQILQNKNAGNDYLGFVSEQIAASTDGSTFNPNNLGYDIDVNYDITKAIIDITLGTVDRTYGNAAITSTTGAIQKDGYGFTIDMNGFTDEMKQEINNNLLGFVVKEDTALSNDPNNPNKVTNDVADTYTWSADFTLGADLNGNYELGTINKGQSHVNKAELNIHSDDKFIAIGQTPNYTGTDINDKLVNGDSLADGSYNYGIEDVLAVNTIGKYPIGIYLNGTYYELGNNWENSVSFFKNYDIKFTPGTLTVNGIYVPVNPPDRNPWDYLYKDNPFDRIKNFRERKAEINFVDGGMEI